MIVEKLKGSSRRVKHFFLQQSDNVNVNVNSWDVLRGESHNANLQKYITL